MRFIGHLDLLKFFQRAVKRAGLPVSYSKGFNPHQIVGFAIPLPLGMASVGEYVDIEFENDIEPEVIVEKLNSAMTDGISILNARKLNSGEKGCAAVIAAAVYEAEFNLKTDNIEHIISDIMLRSEINVERTSKHKTKVVDIRPDIFEVSSITEKNNTEKNSVVLKFTIATGSQRNLKPELFIKYIYDFTGNEFEPLKIKYKRIDLLKEENGILTSL